MTAFLLLIAGGTNLLSHARPHIVPRPKTVEGAQLYAQFTKADDLLRRGDIDSAGNILDAVRSENLVVQATATDAGKLANQSCMVVLMHVIRQTGEQALRSARAGNRTAARKWMLRGWRIGDQVISTPHPDSEALTVAHFADCYLSQTQSAVARLSGDVKAEKAAVACAQHLRTAWRDHVQPEIVRAHTNLRSGQEEDAETMRLLCDRYSRYRLQAGAGTWA